MKNRLLLTGLAAVLLFSQSLPATAAETPAKPKPAPNAATLWAKAKQDLNKNIGAINQILGNPALYDVGLESLARQTGIAGKTLEETRRKSSLSFGDLATACLLAKASGATLDQVRADRRARSWADIAVLRNVKVAELNDKLKAVQTDVDKFIQKQEDDNLNRDLAEQRRQARQRGEAPPPQLPDGPPRER